MFVCSVRASTVRFFAVIVLTVAVLIGVIAFGGLDAIAASAESGSVDYRGVKTEDDRRTFFASFGIEVTRDPLATEEIRLPTKLDAVLSAYNEIQKAQGLDLGKLCRKKLTRYTYEVKNAPEACAPAYVTVYIYRHRVVACDLTVSGEEPRVLPLSDFAALEP